MYPKNSNRHTEDEVIDIHDIDNLYAKTKLLSEDIVKKNCPNFLILRCSALLGKNARRNSLIKIMKEKRPTLTLSGNSMFNYILHKDVLRFIKVALEKDLQGIYNLSSSENISLKGVADLLKKHVNFGNYIYNVGNIDNTKARNLFPIFKKTSMEIVLSFKH